MSADKEANSRTIFIKCECAGEGMSVEHDPKDDLYYFSYWSYGIGSEKLSWRQKIRYCWQVLIKGKPFNDELIFKQNQVNELVDFLASYEKISKYRLDKFISILKRQIKRKANEGKEGYSI